jgi:hypothetical protein
MELTGARSLEVVLASHHARGVATTIRTVVVIVANSSDSQTGTNSSGVKGNIF